MNVVCIGAHPDDPEYFAGGVCAKWARIGHRVIMVSLTNGDIGHHAMAGGVLARRRKEEARRADALAGLVSIVLDNHDGELEPTLTVRRQVVEIIRQYQADLVLTHRPNDYHPDHRYTSLVVQDAAFMVTVPNFCPHVPALRKNPVFLFLMDPFQKPTPFQPDVAVDVTDVMELKWDMLDAMESQFYEWLPWLDGHLDEVPADPAQRRAWLPGYWDAYFRQPAQMARDALIKRYGPQRAAAIHYAELFEICEYGTRPTPEDIAQMFPF